MNDSSSGINRDGVAGNSHAIRSSLQDWVDDKTAGWSSVAFATLNFKSALLNDTGNMLRLDQMIARRAIVLFGNMLDRAVHGRLVQRFNRRVPRIPFLEYGADRGWHCHVLIEPPYSMTPGLFDDLIRTTWAKSPWATTCHIRGADSGAADYLTKGRSKDALEVWSDTLIVEAVVLRTK